MPCSLDLFVLLHEPGLIIQYTLHVHTQACSKTSACLSSFLANAINDSEFQAKLTHGDCQAFQISVCIIQQRGNIVIIMRKGGHQIYKIGGVANEMCAAVRLIRFAAQPEAMRALICRATR